MVWVGARSDILLLWDKKTGKQYSYKEREVLKDISREGNAVQAIIKHRRTGSIWLGTRYDGVYVVECDEAKPVEEYQCTVTRYGWASMDRNRTRAFYWKYSE